MTNLEYSGKEAGIEFSPSSRVTENAFSVLVPNLPKGALPILDDFTGECVGFIHEGSTNVWHIFDLHGQRIGIEESPLEAPVIDPFDLILVGSAVVKLIRSGLGSLARLSTKRAAVLSNTKIARRVLPTLRSKLKGLSVTRLKFTETTARHMNNPGRFVPVHILHLAIKYGTRTPDVQKVAGVFRYEIAISRFVKRGTTFVREPKTLEVVVRESDWTILHFLYF